MSFNASQSWHSSVICAMSCSTSSHVCRHVESETSLLASLAGVTSCPWLEVSFGSLERHPAHS